MSPKHIQLDPNNMGVGTMLEEMVRVFCHHGNSSALVNRVLQGVAKYRGEQELANKLTDADRQVIDGLVLSLHQLHDSLRHTEDLVYADTQPQ